MRHHEPVRVLVVGNVARAGAELYALRLLAGLNPDEFTPILGTTTPVEDPRLVPPGIRVIEFAKVPSTVRTAWTNRSIVPSMARLIRRERIDVCNTMNLGINSLYAHLAARLTGAKSVETIQHTHLLRSRTDGFLSSSTTTRTVRDALVDRYVALCEYLGAEMVDRWGMPPHKIVVNNLGVEVDDFGPRNRDLRDDVFAEFGIPARAVVLGFIGNPNPARRLDVLLLWLAELRRWVPEAVLLAIGVTDDDLGYGAQVEQHGLDDSVFFCGPRDDIPRLLQAVDLYVETAEGPLLGNAQLEAMAAATAVAALVASEEDEVMAGETISEGYNGVLIRTSRLGAEAKRLAPTIRDHRTLRMMGCASREVAVSKFSQREHIKRMQALYRELTKQ